MQYHFSDIQKILNAECLQRLADDPVVTQLVFDSRMISSAAGSLFFALSGKHRDGHQFLEALYAEGVRQFVVSRPVDTQRMPEAYILLVKDTLQALQTVAAAHRSRFQIPVIGITGSNGKTVVKEWLAQLLSPDFDLVRSPKSYNSQIGVPLSVWQMQERHTLAIFEAGISQPGEMAHLEKMIRPDIGIFTNLGPAHQEGFLSMEEKLREKFRLFTHAKHIVCRAGIAPSDCQTPLFTWSDNGAEADLQVLDIEPFEAGKCRVAARLTAGGQRLEILLPFSDAAGLENAMHCWCVMLLLGIAQDEIVRRMQLLAPVEMRLEVKDAVNGCTLVNDAYSNDLASLRIALQFAHRHAGRQPLRLILSDILQSGLPQNTLWQEVATLMQETGVVSLIGIGTQVTRLAAYLPPGMTAHFYPDTNAFLQQIQQFDFRNETILLKGAREFAFERIARRLEQKAHKTVLEVDLSALVHNLKSWQRLLQPGVKMMVMVKAEGYGAGSAQVAKLLEFHGVDYLGVAYTDEGITLREAGVNLPILVLNPEPASLDAMSRFRLAPEVYSLELLQEVAAFSVHAKTPAFDIHLKLDTGMHRLGFEPKDMPALCDLLIRNPQLRVISVFSHLAASDSGQFDDFTRQQARAFSAMYEAIQNALGYAPVRHICNTGGIARWPEYHFEMVRLGIGLYGIGDLPQGNLRTVNTLKATISQIKTIAAGETVGYNRNSGLLMQPKRIATISIGYADGFLRMAGGGRYAVRICGKSAPTIGNVCMDMTMVDVSNIPEARVGDEVIIFGENHPVQALADCLQTIPYEIFTNISGRVKRVYWQE